MTRVSYQVALDLAGRQRMLNQRAMKEALAFRLGNCSDPTATLALLERTGQALILGGETTRGPNESVTLPPPPSAELQLAMSHANQAVQAQKALIEAFLSTPEGGEPPDFGPLLSHGAQVHDKLNHVCVLYTTAIDGLLARQDEQSREVLEACQRGELDFRGRVSTLDPCARSSVEATNTILDAVLAPIPEALQVLDGISEGDLTQRMGEHYIGDHARLATGLNSAIETLNGLLWDLRPVSEEVADHAATLESTASHLSTSTQRQAESVDEVTRLLNTLLSGLTENGDRAGKAAELATRSDGVLARSRGRLDDFMQSVASLEEAAERITIFLGVIDDIAFQTDLLALNAAVEAARAGAHGSGFAVVAQEVRALALRSAKAASQMEEVVRSLDANMHKAESFARTTAEELEQVSLDSHTLGATAMDLAIASYNQAKEIRQTEAAMDALRHATTAGRTAARGVSLSAQRLSKDAQTLKGQQERFQLAPQAPEVAAGFDPELVAQVRAWLERGAA